MSRSHASALKRRVRLKVLGRILRVQQGEGRTVGLIVGLMVVACAGLTIGESGVTALFFDRVGADRLPLIYLAQGVTGLVAMLALTGSLTRFDRRRAYVAMPLLMAAAVLLERATLVADPVWIYPAMWLTVTVGMLLQGVFLWGTAGTVTDVRRAKRLFPLFGAGGILGAVVGGLVTRPLAGLIGAENLLLVWAAALGCAALLCVGVLGRAALPTRGRAAGPAPARLRRRRISALRELAAGASFVRRSPLLLWMTAAAVLFSVLYYTLYLPYAQAASDRFPDPDELAGFFGVFWASVTAVAFLVSVLLANRLLGWLGAGAMIVVLPILYAGSFGVLLVVSSFATLVALRLGVSVWLQGVSSPAWETLVNVVPEGRRDQTRAFLNGGPSQAGTALAGLVALVGQQALSPRALSLIGLASSAITIGVAWRIRRSYTGALVDALRAGRPSVFEDGVLVGAPIVLDRDGQALGLAIEACGDPDPRVRRLAVEMLGAAPDDRARQVLVRALKDEDPLVRANAVRGLERHAEARLIEPALDDADVTLIEPALDDTDAGVRLAAVTALATRTEDPAVAARLRSRLGDPDPETAAATSSVLLAGSFGAEAADRLRRLLSAQDPDVRVAALGQLRLAPPERILELAARCANDPSAQVRSAAVQVLAVAGAQAAFQPALQALGDDEAPVRAAAVGVLADLDLRDHEAELRGFVDARVALAERDRELAASVPADGEAPALLRDAVVDRARRRALAAFSALALLSEDRAAMRTALDNLDAADPAQLANALETIEVAARTPIARPLLGLWEAPTQRTSATGPTDWLQRALGDEDPFIRSCARLVARNEGDEMSRSRTSMSPIERVLVLRKIPLFSELSPSDLLRVAGIAEERTYADGEVVATEGELGDELHIVVEGTVSVVRGGRGSGTSVARRGPGEVVGEMSIITRAPRIASLLADGSVRTLRIGHREFEAMIRERPSVSLAVMQVLAERLGAETADRTVDRV
jgi:HEAT repeat protein